MDVPPPGSTARASPSPSPSSETWNMPRCGLYSLSIFGPEASLSRICGAAVRWGLGEQERGFPGGSSFPSGSGANLREHSEFCVTSDIYMSFRYPSKYLSMHLLGFYSFANFEGEEAEAFQRPHGLVFEKDHSKEGGNDGLHLTATSNSPPAPHKIGNFTSLLKPSTINLKGPGNYPIQLSSVMQTQVYQVSSVYPPCSAQLSPTPEPYTVHPLDAVAIHPPATKQKEVEYSLRSSWRGSAVSVDRPDPPSSFAFPLKLLLNSLFWS